ncbi:hypothetical protein DYH10_01170 [Candidatus Saccharibacteria bacterium CPR2]|nr:hypothetical protein [Candidatus Saccharibacteria bacterium CPR2]
MFNNVSRGVVFAQGPEFQEICNRAPDPKPDFCNNPNSGKDPLTGKDGIITKATQTMVYLVGVLSVIMIMIAGIRFVMSNGDPAGVKGARDALLYAVIGIIIGFSAQLLVWFVLRRL